MPTSPDLGNVVDSSKVNIDDERVSTTGSIFASGDTTVDQITSSNGYSRLTSSLSATMYGLDIFNTGSPAQQTHEQYGLTFFTRPMLNLSYDNITAVRDFSPMATQETASIAAYVRAMLDPYGGWDSDLVDPTNSFMPLLSNTLETLSGWQDPILDTYHSNPGLKKESWSIGDSSTRVYQVFQLSSSHRNVRGNALGYLFHVWQTYIGLVYEGVIDPYPEMSIHNTIDYQSRVYRLILDQTRTRVQEIVCCGATFPLANNAGSRADFNRATPLNTNVDTYSQTWQTMGAFYYDPAVMYDFNKASGLLKAGFNNDSTRVQKYRILWPSEYRLFSYLATPRINPQTAVLEWWVSNEVYKRLLPNSTVSSYTI